jgi:hypothetical protein
MPAEAYNVRPKSEAMSPLTVKPDRNLVGGALAAKHCQCFEDFRG